MSTLPPLNGLHHITAVSGPAKVNFDFYTKVLGLRFVKKTVNFDDPFTYHLYYGNYEGSPGSAITFFPWKNVVQGHPQTGEAVDVQYAVPTGSIEWWKEHFSRLGVSYGASFEKFGLSVLPFRDADGMANEVVEYGEGGGVEASRDSLNAHAIRGFFGTTLNLADVGRTAELLLAFGWSALATEDSVHRFSSSPDNQLGAHIDLVAGRHQDGRFGKGSIHHIAFRVSDDDAQAAWAEELRRMGFQPTPVQERFYFRSIYFREPGGVLFEIATDPPGFTADEPLESLGSSLKLPPWYEPHRERITSSLPEL